MSEGLAAMGAEGIRRGISRASDAELWHDNVEFRAREDVETSGTGTCVRRAGSLQRIAAD